MMMAYDPVDNGEAETDTSVGPAAGVVEPGEPLEHSFAIGKWYSWAVVVHGEHDRAVSSGCGYCDRGVGMAGCVLNEVADDAGKRLLPALNE